MASYLQYVDDTIPLVPSLNHTRFFVGQVHSPHVGKCDIATGHIFIIVDIFAFAHTDLRVVGQA
jgi:hypothetical protein